MWPQFFKINTMTEYQSLLASSFNDFDADYPDKSTEWLFAMVADFHNCEPHDVAEAIVARSEQREAIRKLCDESFFE